MQTEDCMFQSILLYFDFIRVSVQWRSTITGCWKEAGFANLQLKLMMLIELKAALCPEVGTTL